MGGTCGRFRCWIARPSSRSPPVRMPSLLLVLAVAAPSVAHAGELARDRAEKRQDKRELRQDRRELRDDRRDLARLEGLAAQLDRARATHDRAGLRAVDDAVG